MKEYIKSLKLLQKNFYNRVGVISKKDKDYEPTEKEYEAINYLCSEWDYVFNSIGFQKK